MCPVLFSVMVCSVCTLNRLEWFHFCTASTLKGSVQYFFPPRSVSDTLIYLGKAFCRLLVTICTDKQWNTLGTPTFSSFCIDVLCQCVLAFCRYRPQACPLLFENTEESTCGYRARGPFRQQCLCPALKLPEFQMMIFVTLSSYFFFFQTDHMFCVIRHQIWSFRDCGGYFVFIFPFFLWIMFHASSNLLWSGFC